MASRSALLSLQVMLKGLMEAVRPSVVALKCFFSAPENGEFEKCSRAGSGVFVDRALILTSAHVVGIISTVGDSKRTTAFIGKTVAVTTKNKVLKTKLLAVDFSGDIAVLEVEGYEEADLPPPCAVARSVPSKEQPLLVITRHEGCQGNGTLQVKVRSMEDNSARSQWPYALEDGHGWARYGGAPIDYLRIIPGSPWFSPDRQVAGIASRATGDEPADSVGGFVVPPPRLRSVLDYAEKKAPNDSIVLDRWINAIAFADSDNVEEMKCFQNDPDQGFVMTTYLY